MLRCLSRIADALADLWLDKEGYVMMYLMASGALANLAALGYGVYWLVNHVRFV